MHISAQNISYEQTADDQWIITLPVDDHKLALLHLRQQLGAELRGRKLQVSPVVTIETGEPKLLYRFCVEII